MPDLLIKGGTVIDSTGAEPFVADVGVKGEKIVSVERDASGEDVAHGVVQVVSDFDLLRGLPDDAAARPGWRVRMGAALRPK